MAQGMCYWTKLRLCKINNNQLKFCLKTKKAVELNHWTKNNMYTKKEPQCPVLAFIKSLWEEIRMPLVGKCLFWGYLRNSFYQGKPQSRKKPLAVQLPIQWDISFVFLIKETTIK